MCEFTASDAKNNFAHLLDTAQREPVQITKNKRPVAVLLSQQEYDRLQAMEDFYWGELANAAVKRNDFLGHEASEALLKDALNAKNQN